MKMKTVIDMDSISFLGEWFTFRIGETGELTTQCSGCNPLALHEDTAVRLALTMNELFMKIAGAAANCLICAKLCKSMHHEVAS